MKYCNRCKRTMPDRMEFCPQCGAPLILAGRQMIDAEQEELRRLYEQQQKEKQKKERRAADPGSPPDEPAPDDAGHHGDHLEAPTVYGNGSFEVQKGGDNSASEKDPPEEAERAADDVLQRADRRDEPAQEAAPIRFEDERQTILQIPEKYRPLSAWAFFGYTLLFSIPLIGFILLLVFSFSNENINRRNFARSYFCGLLVVAAIILILNATGALALSTLLNFF